MLSKLCGAAEALVKRMRGETGDYAEGQMGQIEDLHEDVERLNQDLDSERPSSGSFKAARTAKEEKAAAEDGGSDSGRSAHAHHHVTSKKHTPHTHSFRSKNILEYSI